MNDAIKRTWRTASCREPLLVTPMALGHEYEKAAVNRPYGDEPCEGVYVIDIHGPLEHHEHVFFASFENISRITCHALERSDVKAVVWRIDSPGGVANGMGSAARELRAHADRLGKKIYAYADEQICSAAYGIACAADEIWCPPTAEIGSVGVILPVVDQTQANANAGVEVALIVTGERKGDGHPDKPLDEATLEALQARVDAIGDDFFALVAEARGMSSEAVRALQAGVYVGPDAVTAGLADGVALWSEFYDAVKLSLTMPAASSAAVAQTPSNSRTNANVKSTKKRSLDATRHAKHNTQKKGVDMAREKRLALAQARQKAEAAVAEASTIADPIARAKAVTTAVAELAKVLAGSRMYKKTIKVEEYDEDKPKEEEAPESEDKDDDEPESQRMEEEPESEDEKKSEDEEDDEEKKSEDEKCEDEEAEEEVEGAEDEEPKKARKAASVAGHVRAITGARTRAEQLGKLDAMAEKARLFDAMAADVAKLKSESRKKRVDEIIQSAITAKKLSPSNAKQIAFLRAQGMESPKRLAAYVEAMPRLVARTLDDGPVNASLNADGGVKHIDQLAPEARKVIELTARTTGISIEKATAEYLTAYNRASGR